ncbi:MAG TPA: hypothetical protein VLG50_07265 [Candidatus Saccharimonadales bacterium]|nr:hypothetical protein [Candidatus Saccharimonadales bacterium]
MSDCSLPDVQNLCTQRVGCTLNHIITINGATGTIGFDQTLANQFFNCAKDKFESIAGDHVLEEIRNQISKIITTSSTATQQVLYIVFGGIAVTLLLLTLIFFAALYWRNEPYVILCTFILALLVLIIAAIIIYLWVLNVYDNASKTVTSNVDNINQILLNVQVAAIAAYCCFGSVNCSSGKPCQCSLPSCII